MPWAYSAYFGTGWYRLTNDLNVFVAQYVPRWSFAEPALEDGKRDLGFWLEVPLSIGFENFGIDDPAGVIDPDNVAIASLTPALTLTIPVNEIWTLRPFGAVGWGTVIGKGDSAWAYWAGVKSRLRFESGRTTFSLVNVFGYVGNTPEDAPSDHFMPAMAGIEIDFAGQDWHIGDDAAFLSWHLSYTRFFDDFEVVRSTGQRDAIPDQWETGFSFGKVGKPIELWWFSFDRFGIAYRVSSNGDLKGVGLVFRSLFDR